MADDRLETIHHEGYDPAINSLFGPAIKVRGSTMVYISGVTAAPVYHDHPHIPADFDAIPDDADAQRRLREVEARLVQLQEAEKAFDDLARAVIEKRPRIRTNPALVIN